VKTVQLKDSKFSAKGKIQLLEIKLTNNRASKSENFSSDEEEFTTVFTL
jgi:hypothetical protein